MNKAMRSLFCVALSLLLCACGGGNADSSSYGPAVVAQRSAKLRIRTASAAPASATEQLLDFGEAAYPSYFPGHKATASYYPFAYRYYAETGVYLGIVVDAGTAAALDSVYVMGGPFGSTPVLVGPMSNYLVGVSGSITGYGPLASGLTLRLTLDSPTSGSPISESVSVSPGASTFSFGTLVPVGARYSVTIQSQPTFNGASVACSISGGDGVATAGSPPAMSVTCGQGYLVAGTITWTAPPAPTSQSAGPVLVSGALTATPPLGATSFTFAPAVAAGTAYNVAVQSDPPDYHCTVTNGSGTVTSNVSSVRVSCVATVDWLTAASVEDAGTTSINGLTLHMVIKDYSVLKFTVDQIRDEFFGTYPEMAAAFNAPAPKDVTVTIDPNPAYPDAAYTSGSNITISSAWLKQNPLDIDVVVHEAFHIVQSYPGGANTPWWITEGLADYARDRYGTWNVYSGWTLTAPSATSSYTDGYGTTGRFLKWLEANYGNVVVPLDAQMRAGLYTANFWVATTGRTVDQLWTEYTQFPNRSLQ